MWTLIIYSLKFVFRVVLLSILGPCSIPGNKLQDISHTLFIVLVLRYKIKLYKQNVQFLAIAAIAK